MAAYACNDVVVVVVLFCCFIQNHYQTCPKFPLACERCGKENITREMVSDFYQIYLYPL